MFMAVFGSSSFTSVLVRQKGAYCNDSTMVVSYINKRGEDIFPLNAAAVLLTVKPYMWLFIELSAFVLTYQATSMR